MNKQALIRAIETTTSDIASQNGWEIRVDENLHQRCIDLRFSARIYFSRSAGRTEEILLDRVFSIQEREIADSRNLDAISYFISWSCSHFERDVCQRVNHHALFGA